MLRKLQRSISRGRERSVSPEFVSADARRTEARALSREGNRASQGRDHRKFSFDTHPAPDTPDSQECPFYLDTTLEALSLETVIKPTLTRMRPTLEHVDKLLPPPPRRASEPAPAFAFPLPPPRAAARERTRVGEDLVVLRAPEVPSLCVTPPTEDHAREVNPYEEALGDLTVTPLPTRPRLKRQAVSYRTQRELPLRVQAVRRSHQEHFAQQLLQRSPILPTQRRASDAGPAPSPPPKQPLPRPPMPERSRSVDSARGRSVSPKGLTRSPHVSRSRGRSRPPINRMPSVQENYPYQDAPDVPDFYLQAALADWSFEG